MQVSSKLDNNPPPPSPPLTSQRAIILSFSCISQLFNNIAKPQGDLLGIWSQDLKMTILPSEYIKFRLEVHT